MTKEELRKHYLNKRKNLSKETLANWSAQITAKLMERLLEYSPKRVHCFLPITANKEYDSLPLIQQLWSKKIEVTVPVSNFETKEMESALFTSDTKVIEKRGIPEPESPNIVEDQTIDLIIVPLTVADKNGFRIGYGGGFYDRFIAKNPQLITIGVSFFDPIVSVYPKSYDEKTQELITPKTCYFFN